MTGDIGPVSNKSDGNDLKNIFQANGIDNKKKESVNVDMINGVDNSNIGIHNSPSSNEGIIPRSLRLIFSQSNERTRISVQFFEIYNESVRNLVTGENSDIKIYKDDVVFSNLEPIDISGIEDVELLLQEIDKKRSVAATRCNPKSSRGHTFFAIQVVRMESCDGSATGSRDILKAAGSLVFVDLAGSERLKASQSADQRLEETKKINSSLLALRKVISALYRKEKHVPYRDSKLTLVLKKYFTARS
ncbi:Kinesin-like protein bimC, partial [Dictyocoela roeselum]